MSRDYVPVGQVPPQRQGKWARAFDAIPVSKAALYSGDQARAVWVAFHKLAKERRLVKTVDGVVYELNIRAVHIREADATVWVYWRETAPR